MRQIKTPCAMRTLQYGATGEHLLGSDGYNHYFLWRVPSLEEIRRRDAGYESTHLLSIMLRPSSMNFLTKQGYLAAGEDLPKGDLKPKHFRIIVDEAGHFEGFGPDGATFIGRHGQTKDSPPTSGRGIWRFDNLKGKRLDCSENLFVEAPWHCAGSGQFLVAKGGYTHYRWKKLQVIDLSKRPPTLLTIDHGTEIGLLACSTTAPLVATAGKTVRLFDALTGECVQQFSAFKRSIEALTFSTDGKLLAAGSREGRVRLWEVESRRQLADLEWSFGRVYALAIAPNNETAAVACGKGVILWDLE